ncbi:7190_t:CDS:1, partial [Funneliformis mosseae]
YKQTGGNNRVENWNNSRFDSSEVDNTESMTASHSDFSSSFAGPSNSSSFAESSSPRQQKPRKRGRKYGSKYDVL